jgi:hypothetical protein
MVRDLCSDVVCRGQQFGTRPELMCSRSTIAVFLLEVGALVCVSYSLLLALSSSLLFLET